MVYYNCFFLTSIIITLPHGHLELPLFFLICKSELIEESLLVNFLGQFSFLLLSHQILILFFVGFKQGLNLPVAIHFFFGSQFLLAENCVEELVVGTFSALHGGASLLLQ